MKRIFMAILAISLSGIVFISIVKQSEEREDETGYADEAFEWWYSQRALPEKSIQPDGIAKAFEYTQRTMLSKKKSPIEEQWQTIGPDNVGGRVLSLAIDPDSSNIVWAGSSSGGLWRSRTGGVGAQAWEYVNTGFYVIAVSTIAINPLNANEMYIGMGEISGYNLGQVGTPGARTTYGGGVVKSIDRGKTWQVTGLNFLFSQNRSVQKIVINPKNPQTIFAATSEGTFRSVNGGNKFVLVDSTLMAMDVALNSNDTSIVYVACGQRNTAPNPGLYRSLNGGNSFTKLTVGLPAVDFGRTSIAISPSSPTTVFVSISNASTHNLDGLYRTTNNGDTWEKMSVTNYLNGQGWYNNICIVHPTNPSIVYGAGFDIYKSVAGGSSLTQKSFWYKGLEGVIPPGGKEGSDNSYAHADHHAMVIDPKNSNRMFFGSDGGVFESTDGGETFIGRNGGFITAQFYNGFANAMTDSLIALGGLQDNGSVKWEGKNSWNKVYGGDGGWSAIDPVNKNIMYEEYVYLAISKSTNGGATWTGIFTSNADSSNFIAPFVVSPSNGNILYAGAKKLYKSTNGGANWFATNSNTVLNGTNISCLDVSYGNSDTVIAATGQRTNPIFEIFYSTNGGLQWTKTSSVIPNRYPTDIAFNPSNSKIAFATFSGYGTSHVFKSTDAGKTWDDISANLPDLPTQSVCVDPLDGNAIYVGTDLGVYRTLDGGKIWEPWFDGMPVAMIIDLSISRVDRRLRAATFGNGVYQRKLPGQKPTVVLTERSTVPLEYSLSQNFPNPFNPSTTISYSIPAETDGHPFQNVTLRVYDVSGKEIAMLVNEQQKAGRYSVQFNASKLSSGVYFYTLQSGIYIETKKMMLMK